MPSPESQSPIGRIVQKIQAEYGRKSLKFVAVSGFNVLLGQGLLLVFNKGLDWGFQPSNVAAVSIGALPAYLLSRYWVWQKRGKNHFLKEVVPFWSLALVGLLVSTWFVGIAEGWSDSVVVLMSTNLLSFGCVWIAKFFILDKILFKQEPLTDEPLDALVDEVLHHRERQSADADV